jgi:hypothetical protein
LTATACEQDDGNQSDARGEALRKAAYCPLTRRAATDKGRALVDEVLRQITSVEVRKRQRNREAEAALSRTLPPSGPWVHPAS